MDTKWEVMDLVDNIKNLIETSKESNSIIYYDVRRLIEGYVNKSTHDAYESGYDAGYDNAMSVIKGD